MAASRTASRPTSSSKKTAAPAAKASRSKAAAGKSAKRPSDSLSKAKLIDMYHAMVLVRRFEETVIELFQEGVLPGFLHVAIGQEAIAIGVGHALKDSDYIGSTHRAHGHILGRGSEPKLLIAEMMGRISGVCQGKGGSMHLSDMSHNVVGANGVVGSGAPMMTGVALAQKQLKTGNVAVAFYGDGASNQGNVHEAMNLAALWDLPALFVLENNRYAESTPYWQQIPVKDLAVRGAAFDMTTYSVDGNDPLAVFDTITKAAEHARSGKGPVYIVCETKRIVGHYVGDSEGYRPKGEAKEWRKDDPLPRFRATLLKRKVTGKELDGAEADVDRIMEEAVQFARDADFPPAEDAMKHVYAEYPYPGPVTGV